MGLGRVDVGNDTVREAGREGDLLAHRRAVDVAVGVGGQVDTSEFDAECISSLNLVIRDEVNVRHCISRKEHEGRATELGLGKMGG